MKIVFYRCGQTITPIFAHKSQFYIICTTITTTPYLTQVVGYFTSLMDPIVQRSYVLVYFHTDADPEKQPDSTFFKELYGLLGDKSVIRVYVYLEFDQFMSIESVV